MEWHIRGWKEKDCIHLFQRLVYAITNTVHTVSCDIEWTQFRIIETPLKLLQTASRVDTILKRYDKKGAAIVDFQVNGQNDRLNMLTVSSLDQMNLISKSNLFKLNSNKC